MPKRRLILGILALGILAALIFSLTRPRDPPYKGHPLSWWLIIYATNYFDSGKREGPLAAEAIRHVGTNALPLLVKTLGYEQPAWRTKFHKAMNRLPARLLPDWMKQDQMELRANGAYLAFTILRQHASPARPRLATLANKSTNVKTIGRSTFALSYLGPESLPALTALATQSPPAKQTICLAAIWRLGTNARPAAPTLLTMLNDPDPNLRENIMSNLIRIDPEALTKVPPWGWLLPPQYGQQIHPPMR